jgi:D-alanyl-D-alanine carboxypeptidase
VGQQIGDSLMRFRRGLVLGLWLAIGVLVAACTGQSAGIQPAFAATLEPLLAAKIAQLGTPGAAVWISVPGQGSWTKTFGVSDRRTGTAMSAENHTRIGSVTKTMTAAVVLQLVDEGLVMLDEPIATYLPGVPNGEIITVRQLLNMTSGLANTTESDAFNRALDADTTKSFSVREVLQYAFDEPPLFAPGAQFYYTNTNYDLLGELAETVTGEGLPDLFSTRLFRPLGMTESSLPALTDNTLPEPFTHGYNYGTNVQANDALKAVLAGNLAGAQVTVPAGTEPRDSTNDTASYAWASGAAISTLDDLAIWAKELGIGTLLDPNTQQNRLDFSKQDYGLGVRQAAGGWVGHNGAIPGYQTWVGYQPGTGATVIVVANMQLAPNVFLGDGLPADSLAQIITEKLANG